MRNEGWLYFGAIIGLIILLFFFAFLPSLARRPEIRLSSLTLSQKLHQMVIVQYSPYEAQQIISDGFGGVHFSQGQYPGQFIALVRASSIARLTPFLSADLEGCVNPFSKEKNFTALSNITSRRQAYDTGLLEGRFLTQAGINMDFSPVLGLNDNITHCRAFGAGYRKTAALGKEYIKGLEDYGIIAVAKHYPGAALEGNDLHYNSSTANISSEDIYPFNYVKNEADAIMVSHQIVSGALNSNGRPSDVSPAVISSLRDNFSGLIITDDVNMPSLRGYYAVNGTVNRTAMYADLINAGNDVIIDFDSNLTQINDALSEVQAMVESGSISNERIDNSVTRILNAKGYRVIP